MTRRGLGVLAALLTSGLCALSIGGMLYYYISLLLLVMLLYSFFSCLWARGTAWCRQSLSAKMVHRGENAQLFLQAGHSLPPAHR